MKTLEQTLHEITPAPDPEFVEEMEERMRLGFPPERPPRLGLPKLNLPRFRPPVIAGAAASAVLALLVTVALVGNETSQERRPDAAIMPEHGAAEVGRESPAAGEAAPLAADETDRSAQDELQRSHAPGTASEPVVRPPGRGGVAPNRRDRQVERSAELVLAAEPAGFDRMAESIFAIAARRGGFVLHSQFTHGEEGVSGGSFELRVPVNQLQSALNALSRLGSVRSRSESGTDVTGRFVTLRDRLQIARADRKGLLTRLENADSDRAARAIRRRLEIVTREINGLRARLGRMRERTHYAAVSVELVDEATGATSGTSDAGEALDDAVGSLEGIGLFLVRALGVLLPVGLAALLGWFAASRARRRARERALA